MKIVSALMISVILFSVLFIPGCAPQGEEEESVPILSLSATMGTYEMGDRCEFVAVFMTPEGEPYPFDYIISVRFAMAENSVHHPSNLMEDEFYEREVCEWVESTSLSCEGEYLRPLISEHWKREKVYTTSNNYVYCSTGGDNGEAKFAYIGIKSGTDTWVVSATVDGDELQETATVTWQYPENTCILDLINNTLSPTNDVVTPVGPVGDGKAVVEIDMGAGNYSVLEMKIKVEDPTPIPDGQWLLNIGNSPSNNGAGGDAGDFSNDSELDITNEGWDFTLRLYANGDHTPPGAVVFNLTKLFAPPTAYFEYTLRVKIADQKMRALIEGGQDSGDFSNPYIFRLGGPDAEAVTNDFIYYAAFNRVISDRPDRVGSRVTGVTFMWRNTWTGPDWAIP